MKIKYSLFASVMTQRENQDKGVFDLSEDG